LRPAILCVAILLGVCGCSVSRDSAAPTAAAKPAVATKPAEATKAADIARPWSLMDLPSANLPDKTIQSVLAELQKEPGHLTLDTRGGNWSLSEVEETDRRMNREEVGFLLNQVPLGAGDQGLANFRKIVSLTPPKTRIMTDHCLSCQKNRWSEKVHMLSQEREALGGNPIHCDGAF
jgi:hypothetical protein